MVQAIDKLPSLTCPACGGAGGGPFGRLGGAWDTEEYVCARCVGTGVISSRPSVAKTTPSTHPAPYSEREHDRDARDKKRALGED
jgi:DNA-directed RNA polymerase subunit RPC12/RpoP